MDIQTQEELDTMKPMLDEMFNKFKDATLQLSELVARPKFKHNLACSIMAMMVLEFVKSLYPRCCEPEVDCFLTHVKNYCDDIAEMRDEELQEEPVEGEAKTTMQKEMDKMCEALDLLKEDIRAGKKKINIF